MSANNVLCANNCGNDATVISYVVEDRDRKCGTSGYCPCHCVDVPLCDDCFPTLPNKLNYRNKRGFMYDEQTNTYITTEQFIEELMHERELMADLASRNFEDFYHKRGIYDIAGVYGVDKHGDYYDLESPMTMQDMY